MDNYINILFQQNNNDDELLMVFAKLNLKRNYIYSMIEKKYIHISCIMFKTFKNITVHEGIKLIYISL